MPPNDVTPRGKLEEILAEAEAKGTNMEVDQVAWTLVRAAIDETFVAKHPRLKHCYDDIKGTTTPPGRTVVLLELADSMNREGYVGCVTTRLVRWLRGS